jgi:hypothetical protein
MFATQYQTRAYLSPSLHYISMAMDQDEVESHRNLLNGNETAEK